MLHLEGEKEGICEEKSRERRDTDGQRRTANMTAQFSSFKKDYPLEKREAEASKIRSRHPDRIPVIVERAEKSDIPDIDKNKYLVPGDLTVGQIVFVIRKRIKLSAEKAIFIFAGNVLPPSAALLSTVYDEHKDDDGFLYLTYSGENTFGGIDLSLPEGNCLSES